jgi:hypothetical protein
LVKSEPEDTNDTVATCGPALLDGVVTMRTVLSMVDEITRFTTPVALPTLNRTSDVLATTGKPVTVTWVTVPPATLPVTTAAVATGELKSGVTAVAVIATSAFTPVTTFVMVEVLTPAGVAGIGRWSCVHVGAAQS